MHTACASHMRPSRAARIPQAPRRIACDSQPNIQLEELDTDPTPQSFPLCNLKMNLATLITCVAFTSCVAFTTTTHNFGEGLGGIILPLKLDYTFLIDTTDIQGQYA